MVSNLYAFDWSGTLSDDRRPVYTANMRLLEYFGESTMTFEEWLPRTTLSPVEFMHNHGIFEERERPSFPSTLNFTMKQ